MIDWFAVQCVLEGTKMALRPPERKQVVRRMRHKLQTLNATMEQCEGMMTNQQLADLMCCHSKAVERFRHSLPEAVQYPCPVCHSSMWVTVDGLVEPHPDKLLNDCPMANRMYDLSWEARTFGTVKWLSQRLRDGDAYGVWEHIGQMSVAEGRELVVAALAGVSIQDDPFEWLQETA